MILTMLLDILCTMGLPSVDDSLQRLLNAMHSFPAELGSTEGIARLVGCGIALGVGSYEAWMMMLGRRGIDVMDCNIYENSADYNTVNLHYKFHNYL